MIRLVVRVRLAPAEWRLFEEPLRGASAATDLYAWLAGSPAGWQVNPELTRSRGQADWDVEIYASKPGVLAGARLGLERLIETIPVGEVVEFVVTQDFDRLRESATERRHEAFPGPGSVCPVCQFPAGSHSRTCPRRL